MDAVVCACGRRVEREYPSTRPTMFDLRAPGHDPNECSRQIGFQGRFDGRREMAEFAIEHLAARRALGGAEIAEIRTNLLDAVNSMPLGKRV